MLDCRMYKTTSTTYITKYVTRIFTRSKSVRLRDKIVELSGDPEDRCLRWPKPTTRYLQPPYPCSRDSALPCRVCLIGTRLEVAGTRTIT